MSSNPKPGELWSDGGALFLILRARQQEAGRYNLVSGYDIVWFDDLGVPYFDWLSRAYIAMCVGDGGMMRIGP